MEFIVDSINKTIDIGNFIGSHCNSGDILCLNGDLGAGKTHLSKGIAKGLNIKDNITSPTFNIVNEYDGRLKLYHFDVYRVNDPDEIEAIGFDEYIFGEGISIIEWSDYIEDLIPNEHMDIRINKIPEKGESYRKVTINYHGNRYDYIKELKI
ncbi:tRNA (adenosine(37)-N6)-threonylcarbamoyltransferase complex ATPase subunit type 1 TsaE [Clostridium sporogenes]|jgi:tRNA threonylcarbamoyladenosine biosynthesis protein TsaE|uniref:tRNA threonylcarbamoyladenosine biosynthesis protein TsaE n=2 Tax=Clostridium TaxID=1485 RepID=A0A0D1BTX8_CLOBO|nr:MULTISPECIES: tRNA (adenosine(37)-N6)-threonylcarbamoyltransferase complex ATPase subunit type 1 TsaE [Clostridium]MBE6078373.1 tRNA (adenosine(37)-N6)-threonylcarbamoyltransferase complex ATPase subunit type 1 TsaE [Clostridium lundense]MDU2832120.1 tRNA (adenosine(37)-N6)-threonylcarbamoyltransferase complex ATPase subunit type 1 TsaE [Clostridium botulinum]KIS22211.1 ATP-binding protein [Clostridium botulinum B2 450]MCW6092310.1 tRNA (adenosine(37)-N6)-threonylcarbamoyltransferase complex